MITINLLGQWPAAAPTREWPPREQRSALVGLGLLAVTALVVGGWWYALHRARVDLDARIEATEHELVRLNDAAKSVADLSKRKTELAARISLVEQLKAAKRAPVTLLETVSRSVPDGLWLLDLKETGASAEIDGRATSLTSVTDFAARLEDSGLFTRPVEILTTTTEVVDEVTLVRFALKADTRQLAPTPVSASPAGPGSGSQAISATGKAGD